MILEMRTTRYVPGATAKVNAAYESGLGARLELSPLAGFFHVDVGVLNTTYELWPYADANERAETLERSAELLDWPPEVSDIRVGEETMVLSPADSNPEFELGAFGNVYEFRMYEVVAGKMQQALSNWAERIEARAKLSPFIGLFYNEVANTNAFVHIWAYEDGAHRSRVRADAQARGLWPPQLAGAGLLLRQDVALALPAPFSPLH